MSFGKVGPDGQKPVLRPAATSVAAKKDLDTGFIVLVVAVVVLAASLAVLVPAAMGWMSGAFSAPKVRTIEEIVATRDRNAIKLAFETEALPDADGRAFLGALKQHFPQDHDALMGRLADSAMAGGDRRELVLQVNEWIVPFVISNASAIGRSGAAGFDRTVKLGYEMMGFMRELGGGRCTADSFQAVAMKITNNPQSFTDLVDFGSAGYRLNMRADQAIVELAALGRNAPATNGPMSNEDQRAIQMVTLSLITDPQIMSLMTASTRRGGPSQAELSKIDICKLGDALLKRVETLPASTKARLTSSAMEQVTLQGRTLLNQMSMR